MARVYYSVAVRRIMGRIKDQIYSAHGPFEYIKSYNHPPFDPKTDRQKEIRGIFDQLTDDWVVLPENKRKLWHKFAVLTYNHGDGISLFLRHNLRLLSSKNPDLVKIDIPPSNPEGILGIATFGLTAEAGQNVITWIYSAPPESLYCQVFFRHHKPNLLDVRVYYALIDTVPVDDLELVHVHGFPPGTVLHYRLRVIDLLGRITPYSEELKVVCQ